MKANPEKIIDRNTRQTSPCCLFLATTNGRFSRSFSSCSFLVANVNTWSYSLSGIDRYNDLRCNAVSTPRILVVLFLPHDPKEWLSLDENALLLRKCAYWVSLRGAGLSSNTAAQTVYIPKSQRFDPDGLTALMSLLSHNKVPQYGGAAV